MHSTLYILLSSIPMFVCGFWTLIFMSQYKNAHISKKTFFWFIITATFLYFAHFVVFNHIYNLIPLTDTVYTFATLSVYPIFYLYIVALTGELKRKNMWVLLPGIMIASIVGICYLLIPQSILHNFLLICHYEADMIVSNIFATISLHAHSIMMPIILIEISLVVFFGFKRLNVFKNRVNESFSNTEHKELGEVKLLLIIFITTSCLSVIADIMGRAFFTGTCFLVSLPTISFGIVLFIIGYIVYHQKFTIEDILQEESLATNSVQQTENLEMEERLKLRQEIDRLMTEDQIFLSPDLKISDLANMLNTNRTYIYEALKLKGKGIKTVSFSNYVNQYRIAYCIKQIQKSTDIKIEVLAYESGFVSKAAFYRNFKKFTGKTPTSFYEEERRRR